MDKETARSGNSNNGAGKMVDVEVRERPERRRFGAKYKLRILRAAAAAKDFGAVAALLRREGLYSSHLTRWRQQCERSALREFSQSRGRKPSPRNPLANEVSELHREVAQLQQKLTQAELIMDVQKKLSTMLGLWASHRENDGSSS